MEEKIQDNGIKVEGRAASKLSNFWYYHKWKVIIGIFVAIVLGVCVWSCLAKPKTDIDILYAGPFDSMNSATQKMTETLSRIEPETVGTNGIGLNVISYFTEEQAEKFARESVEDYIAEEKENGRFYSTEEKASLISQQIDRYNSLTMSAKNSLGSQIGMGHYTLYLLDPAVYEIYSANEVFVLLSDIFGENIPASAYSEDAIRLSETSLYKNDPSGIGKLPADTLICLRVEPVFGGCGGKNSVDYEKAVAMFIEMTK